MIDANPDNKINFGNHKYTTGKIRKESEVNREEINEGDRVHNDDKIQQTSQLLIFNLLAQNNNEPQSSIPISLENSILEKAVNCVSRDNSNFLSTNPIKKQNLCFKNAFETNEIRKCEDNIVNLNQVKRVSIRNKIGQDINNRKNSEENSSMLARDKKISNLMKKVSSSDDSESEKLEIMEEEHKNNAHVRYPNQNQQKPQITSKKQAAKKGFRFPFCCF